MSHAETKEQRSHLLVRFIRFMSSMPVAIFLLILVALASMIGTILVQNRDQDFYMSTLGATWYKVFSALDMFNMYDSWWFITIMTLLVTSVSAAVIRHGPRFWRQAAAMDKFRPWPAKYDVGLSLRASIDEEQAIASLQGIGFKEFKSKEQGDTVTLVARKGRWSRYGFFLVHCSVVLICIGGLVTSQVGFRGTMNIPEGDNSGIIYVPDGADFRRLELPFHVYVDEFNIDFYDTGMPSLYRSKIRLQSFDGELLAEKEITVNDPLRYQGITFYQASFGDAGSQVNFTLRDITEEEFTKQEMESTAGASLEDGKGLTLEIKEFRQHNVFNVSEDPDKIKYQDMGASVDILYSSPMAGGILFRAYLSYPHILAFMRMGEEEMTYDNLGFSPGDDSMVSLLNLFLKKQAAFDGEITPEMRRNLFGEALDEMNIPRDKAFEYGPAIMQAETVLKSYQIPMLFHFTGFVPKSYTGLQVARDPGSPLVWIGSALLVIGLYMLLYIHEARVWLRWNRNQGKDIEVAAVLSAKDKHPLEKLMADVNTALLQPVTGKDKKSRGKGQ